MLWATLLFVGVALASLAVWKFTNWVKGLGAPPAIWIPSEAVGYLIFAVDVICAVLFIVVEGYKLARDILRNNEIGA
jgi:hypothetical protein